MTAPVSMVAGLVRTLDGVALEARVGLDNGGLDEHRRGHAHELVVGEEQLAGVVLPQPLQEFSPTMSSGTGICS